MVFFIRANVVYRHSFESIKRSKDVHCGERNFVSWQKSLNCTTNRSNFCKIYSRAYIRKCISSPTKAPLKIHNIRNSYWIIYFIWNKIHLFYSLYNQRCIMMDFMRKYTRRNIRRQLLVLLKSEWMLEEICKFEIQ